MNSEAVAKKAIDQLSSAASTLAKAGLGQNVTDPLFDTAQELIRVGVVLKGAKDIAARLPAGISIVKLIDTDI